MKLHRNLASAVAETLLDIFARGSLSDRATERTLKSRPQWGARDRAFAAAAIYDCVRWWRLLGYGIEAGDEDKISAPAVWRRLGAYLAREGHTLPDWPEFAGLDADRIRARMNDPELPRALRAALPDWLDGLCEREVGGSWPDLLAALNAQAPVVLRANTLKAPREAVGERLLAEGYATRPLPSGPDAPTAGALEAALLLDERRPVTRGAAFREGWFEIQDAASQCVAPLLQVEPGMMVLDGCAGAGGKSLHLAALLQNQGRVLACDVEKGRLEELNRRAARAGATCIETVLVSATGEDPRRGVTAAGDAELASLSGTVSRVLVDAPCSGLGTLRRQPDIKWRLTPAFLDEVRAAQRALLERYSALLAPEGLMVYATCSVLPSEGEEQVAWFVGNHSGFQVEHEVRLSPLDGPYDGFYMARLRRR